MMGLKEAYQGLVDAQLCEWQAWIERYKSDRSVTRLQTAQEYEHMMKRLDDCYQDARAHLGELRNTRDEHWEFRKQAVERAMIDLKRVLDVSGAAQNANFLTLQTSRAYVYEPFHRKG